MAPPPKPVKGKRRGKGRRDEDGEYGGYSGREQKLTKPQDQEKLSESQLKEEIQRVLVTSDPTVRRDRVIWDFRERAFLVVPSKDETITLFHMDSELVEKAQVEEFKKVYPYPLIDVVNEDDPKVIKERERQQAEAAAALAAGASQIPPVGMNMPGSTTEIAGSVPAKVQPEAVPGQPSPMLPQASETSMQPPVAVPGQTDLAAEQAGQVSTAPSGTAQDEEGNETEDKKTEIKPDEEEDDKDEPQEDSKQSKFLNQFDYSDRTTQTYNNPLREHACQTQPPNRSNYKEYCNAWIIYDAYEADAENRPKTDKQKDENGPLEQGTANSQTGGAGDAGETGNAKQGQNGNPVSGSPSNAGGSSTEKEEKPLVKEGKISEKAGVKMRKASVLEGQAAQELALAKSAEGLKILERLVMQNVHNEVLFDFKYYEDNSDEFRETGEGTLLPLWKFAFDKAKRLHVTGICWSKSEPDMFAVTYGSFSFTHPIADGMLLIWSLRNPAFPEQVWISPRGCMCCAIHPLESSMVAVGMYDGNVAMILLQPDNDNATSTVILKNVHVVQKHRSPIWSIKWGENDMDGEPNFYSCGMDGRIIFWKIDTSDTNGVGGLGGTEISTLHLPQEPVQGPDGTNYKLFGCARVLAFHPIEKHTYLVGTAEGNIFRCSALYGARYQQIYDAHFLPVAALEWNYYHVDVFISCSEDWTIKIWDKKDPEPMYVFEIGVAILDCCWAPYSSTVFAAVTEEGKCLVYDLNVNKEKPICCQQIVTKKKVRPHRIQFNPYYPVIIIGDDRGQLTTLKLSPNLRIQPKDLRGGLIEGEAKYNFEVGKMTKLLSLVRDPESISNPKSLARPDEKQVKIVLSAMGKEPKSKLNNNA